MKYLSTEFIILNFDFTQNLTQTIFLKFLLDFATHQKQVYLKILIKREDHCSFIHMILNSGTQVIKCKCIQQTESSVEREIK